MKAVAAGALLAAGAHRAVRAVRQLQAGGARVLLVSYHRATLDFAESAREGLPSMLVSAATLRRQLEQLARTWEIVSLSEAARVLAEGPRGPPRAFVAITFDDGYADNHAVALPVLAALRVPATVYVATGFIGTESASRTTACSRRCASSPAAASRPSAPGSRRRCRRYSPPAPRAQATLDRLIARLPSRACSRSPPRWRRAPGSRPPTCRRGRACSTGTRCRNSPPPGSTSAATA